jgi:hypothetical protein
MQKKYTLKGELLWITGIVLVSALISWFGTGANPFSGEEAKIPYRLSEFMAVELVVNRWMTILPALFFLMWIVYTIRAFLERFTGIAVNILLAVSASALIYLVIEWIKVIQPFEYTGGWTVPLNMLQVPPQKPNPDVRLGLWIFYSVIVLASLSFILAAYRTIRLKFKK